MIEPWREPVRGGHPDASVLALPGIEQLRRIASGETPAPPLSRLTGLTVEAVAEGAVTFTMPLTRWLESTDDVIAPGALAIPADGAMACAIMTVLPARTPLTTSELGIRLLRPIARGGSVHARGMVISVGSPIALAETSLHDDDGTLIGHGTSLCMVLEPGSPPDRDQPAPPDDGPDPWQREPPDGDRPPLHLLTGLSREDRTGYTLPASPWFQAPPPGRVQGGVVALLAERAMADAVQAGTPAGTAYRPIEYKLNYLRPLPSDDRTARATARLVHAGRRIAVATAEVVDADARPIAVASGSGLLSRAQ